MPFYPTGKAHTPWLHVRLIGYQHFLIKSYFTASFCSHPSRWTYYMSRLSEQLHLVFKRKLCRLYPMERRASQGLDYFQLKSHGTVVLTLLKKDARKALRTTVLTFVEERCKEGWYDCDCSFDLYSEELVRTPAWIPFVPGIALRYNCTRYHEIT